MNSLKSFKGFKLIGLLLVLLVGSMLIGGGLIIRQKLRDTSTNKEESDILNNEKKLETKESETKNSDNCPYDECLNNGYYIINAIGTNSSYKSGCQSEGLENVIEKCILKIGDMYVAPGSTEVSKTHRDKAEDIAPKKDKGVDMCDTDCDLYDDSDLNGDITNETILDGEYGSAAQYCAQLNIAGLDWRLPSMGNKDNMGTGLNLQEGIGNGGLADMYVAFDNDMLVGEKTNEYWSSTYYGQIKDESAWWLRFLNSGNTGTNAQSSSVSLRCISESE